MYGMHKTTVYLPDELKSALRHTAHAAGVSEAALIREGVRRVIERHPDPVPTLPLFSSGRSDLSERFDELMEGFGEDR